MTKTPNNFFRRRRNELAKTQFQMALLIGVQPATVSLWEHGGVPGLKLIDTIAVAYDVSPDEVVAVIVAASRNKAAVGAA